MAVPSDLDQEDIKNPLNINNFWCMSYLEKKIPDFFEEQKASMEKGERPDPVTKKLWQDCMRRKGEITAKCESGEMTVEMYADLLKKQYLKDCQLLTYFKQAKDLTKAKIVFERLNIIKQECESEGI